MPHLPPPPSPAFKGEFLDIQLSTFLQWVCLIGTHIGEHIALHLLQKDMILLQICKNDIVDPVADFQS